MPTRFIFVIAVYPVTLVNLVKVDYKSIGHCSLPS